MGRTVAVRTVPAPPDGDRYRLGVVLLIAAVVGGVLAGRVRARAGIHVPHHRLRGRYFLVGGLAFHVAALVAEDDIANLLEGGTYACLACFAGMNWAVTGLAVAGLGLVLNLVGIVINNGVPVRPEALVDSGSVTVAELPDVELDPPQHLETSADRAPWLGDVIPIDGLHEVVSFGDLIALIGLVDGLRDLTRRRTKAPEHDPTGFWTRGQAPMTTAAKVDQDWGTAPRPVAESGSQYSAKSDRDAAVANEFWSAARVTPSPAHFDARHSK
jgi:hypothetical protein